MYRATLSVGKELLAIVDDDGGSEGVSQAMPFLRYADEISAVGFSRIMPLPLYGSCNRTGDHSLKENVDKCGGWGVAQNALLAQGASARKWSSDDDDDDVGAGDAGDGNGSIRPSWMHSM